MINHYSINRDFGKISIHKRRNIEDIDPESEDDELRESIMKVNTWTKQEIEWEYR